MAEILCIKQNEFKRDQAFLYNDLRFLKKDTGEVEGIQLWIRHAKVQDQSGALVEIPLVDKFPDICPVKAVKRLIKMRNKLTKEGEIPLFLDDDQKLLTKNSFSRYIHQAIDNLDPSYKPLFNDLKGHSLRSGVPTALQKLSPDIDPQVLKYLGRWRGCSVNLYLKDVSAAAEARLAVARTFNDNL